MGSEASGVYSLVSACPGIIFYVTFRSERSSVIELGSHEKNADWTCKVDNCDLDVIEVGTHCAPRPA